MGAFLNIPLMRNPVNWLTVTVMLALGAVIAQFIAQSLTNSQT